MSDRLSKNERATLLLFYHARYSHDARFGQLRDVRGVDLIKAAYEFGSSIRDVHAFEFAV